MKLEKFNKNLKIFIIVLSIVLLVAIPISLLNYTKEEEKLKTNECTKKGNTCTTEEIISGVEVLVEVKDGKKYVFNVISNDENTMTLMMNKNIKKEVEWQFEGINLKGPASAQFEVQKLTTTWENIDKIDNYEYIDGGRLNYEENCQNGTATTDYDCSTEIYSTRGYLNLTIIDGVTRLYPNILTTTGEHSKSITVLSSYAARARLITLEEIQALSTSTGLPKWLVSNLDEKEGYWTMTSSTASKVSYNAGAIAISKNDGKTSMEMLYALPTLEPDFTIGVRPVITIDKQQ